MASNLYIYIYIYIYITICIYIYILLLFVYILYSICTPISDTRTQGGVVRMRQFLETRSDRLKSISSNSLESIN